MFVSNVIVINQVNISVFNYLSGVDNDTLIILDAASNEKPTHLKCGNNVYFAKSWIYSTMSNNGGDQGLNGPLNKISYDIPYLLNNNAFSKTIIGLGTTMEGSWQNYIIYDASYKMQFENTTINLNKFINKYAMQRYGLPHILSKHKYKDKDVEIILNNITSAWMLLKNSIYDINYTTGIHKSLTNYAPTFYIPTQNIPIIYDTMDMQTIWKYFINVIKIVNKSSNLLNDIKTFRYDLIDITRQCLSHLFQIGLNIQCLTF